MLPAAQTVGPPYPLPPHCPYLLCVNALVVGALVVIIIELVVFTDEIVLAVDVGVDMTPVLDAAPNKPVISSMVNELSTTLPP